MNHPLSTNEKHPTKRINDLFSVYIQQVNRVYKLPRAIEGRLTSMLTTHTAAVWVVDDDLNDQLFIKTAFNCIRPDISITTLDNGEALMSRISTAPTLPSVIILDLNMPRVSGLDTLQMLRSNQNFNELTIVVLTSSSDAYGDRRKALALGADQFYSKPSTYKDLISLIEMITVNWCV